MNKSKRIAAILEVEPTLRDEEIASRVGCTRSLVCTIRCRIQGPKLTAARRAREQHAISPHLSAKQIAAAIGAKESTVRSALKAKPRTPDVEETLC